jgi:hypothetical protein
MFKHIVHLIFFAAGAGVGIWWGVNHPTQAADIAAQEQIKMQQAVAAAKQTVLQQVVAEQQADSTAPGSPTATPATTAHLNTYKDWLNKANTELKNLSAKTSN